MAAGTDRLPAAAATSARCCSPPRWARSCTPTSSRSPTPSPTALHPARRRHLQRRAGAAAGAGDEERRGRRRGLHQPDRHAGRPLPRPSSRCCWCVAAPLRDAGVPGDALLRRPDLAAQRDSAIDFARYCLPQVFFYGMFVLVGQMLNARGKFGPMMWAPIANNLIAMAVLVSTSLSSGARGRASRSAPTPPGRSCCSASAPRSASSLQFLILVPFLRAGGLQLPPALRLPRHRPGPHAPARRLDGAVRGGQPDRLHRRRPAGLERHRRRRRTAPAYTIYSSSVPDDDGAARHHDGLAGHRDPAAALRDAPPTAAAPTGADPGRSTLRTALVVVLPFALLLPVVSREIADVLCGVRRRRPTARFAPTLAALRARRWCSSPSTT